MLKDAPTDSPAIATLSPVSLKNEYAELKQRIREKGLLSKQPVYYTGKILLTMSMLILGLIALVTIRNLAFQLVDAAFLALVFAQIGFLGHDAGHRQIFSKTWMNDFAGLIFGNLIIGMSTSWWTGKHNEHHSHPNQVDLDPDIDIPILAFSEADVHKKHKFERFIVRHQAFFFIPLLFLVAMDMQRVSIVFLLHNAVKYRVVEILLILLHLILPIGFLLYWLGPWQALVFLLIHQGILGFVLGSAFAPNHKGMPILAKDNELNFLRRQVLTARNIKAGILTDFWYGGLNYQIEHHLFPSVPRNRLKEVQKIVRNFCQERDIPYYETGILQSYKEILQHLHEVGSSLKTA